MSTPFPGMESPRPPDVLIRWVRLTVALDDMGATRIAEVQALGRSGESVHYRAFSPLPGANVQTEALLEVLECAKRLTMG